MKKYFLPICVLLIIIADQSATRDVQTLKEAYKDAFLIGCAVNEEIDLVTFWGVHDGMSWKNGYPIPGRTNYPLLYDRNKNPKPAFDALIKLPKGNPSK
jgi:endo-1,4-beta-xylanase